MLDWNEKSESELLALTRSDSIDERGQACEVLGSRYAARGNLRLARAYYEQSIETNDEASNLEWASTSRLFLGKVLLEMDEPAPAVEFLTEAVSGFQTLLWDRSIADALRFRGLAHQRVGRLDAARTDFVSAAELFQELGVTMELVKTLRDHAAMEAWWGNYVQVSEILSRASWVLETTPEYTERLTVHLCLIEAETFLREPADELITGARQLGRLTDEDWHTVIIESWAARNLVATNRLGKAQKVIDRMDSELPASDGKTHRVAILRSLLADAMSGGQSVGDVNALKAAYLIGTSYEDSDWLPLSTKLLAHHYSRKRKFTTALRYVQETLRHFQASFPPPVMFELRLIETEILASSARWDVVAERLREVELPHTPEWVEHCARLLKLTIIHNLGVESPLPEIAHRLFVATATTWQFPGLATTGDTGCEAYDFIEIPSFPVPTWLRAWAFEKSAGIQQMGVDRMDTLAKVSALRSGFEELPAPEPLGKASYTLDRSIYTPYVTSTGSAEIDDTFDPDTTDWE